LLPDTLHFETRVTPEWTAAYILFREVTTNPARLGCFNIYVAHVHLLLSIDRLPRGPEYQWDAVIARGEYRSYRKDTKDTKDTKAARKFDRLIELAGEVSLFSALSNFVYDRSSFISTA
jgi:hypothetical protein